MYCFIIFCLPFPPFFFGASLFLLLASCFDLQLLLHGSPVSLCATCRIPRPLRAKHCPLCHCCVARLDHHCYWINNCVGEQNYTLFLFFCIVMVIGLLCYWSIIPQCIGKESELKAEEARRNGEAVPKVIKLRWLNFPVFYWYFLRTHPFMFIHYLIIVLLLVFLLSLCADHVVHVWLNCTTNEELNKSRYSSFHLASGEIVNPYNRERGRLTDEDLRNGNWEGKTMKRYLRRTVGHQLLPDPTTNRVSSSSSSLHPFLLPPVPPPRRSGKENLLERFFSLERQAHYERLTLPNEVVLLEESEPMDEFTLRALPNLPQQVAGLHPFCILYHSGSFLPEPPKHPEEF